MDDRLAFYFDIEDTEDTKIVEHAYCAITEVHLNIRSKLLVAVVECWRSKEACLAGKNSFNAIEIVLDDENGGPAYFQTAGIDGAQLHLVPTLRDFILTNSEQFSAATPADVSEQFSG